jgi:hypothetical protein
LYDIINIWQSVAKFNDIWYNISMMELIIKSAKSRTVWTIVFIVVTNIVSSLTGVVSPDVLALVNTILGALAVYFRITPSVKF